jgi:hypothetical protein
MQILCMHFPSIFCIFLFFVYFFLCTFFAFFASADRRSRCIRYRDNIGDNQYGESCNSCNKQYSSKNLSYCPIHRFLESVTLLRLKTQITKPNYNDLQAGGEDSQRHSIPQRGRNKKFEHNRH